MGATQSGDAWRRAFEAAGTPRGYHKLSRAFQELQAEQKLALLSSKDDHGRSMLLVAVLNGRVKTASLLLREGASVRARTANGLTALHYAVAVKNEEKATELAALLLRFGADPLVRDVRGQMPFHVAQFSSRVIALRHLEAKVCDFVGNLKLEMLSWGHLYLGEDLRTEIIERLGTAWKQRWVVISRLRGSRAMARVARVRCAACKTPQPRTFEYSPEVCCGHCGQKLLVPPPQRTIFNCLTVYENNNSPFPLAVYDLAKCEVKMEEGQGLNIIELKLSEECLNYVDPAYLHQKKFTSRFKRTKRRMAARGRQTIRLQSADVTMLHEVHEILSRRLRTCPEPDSEIEERSMMSTRSSTSSGCFPIPSRNGNARNLDDIPLALAISEEEDEEGRSRSDENQETGDDEEESGTAENPVVLEEEKRDEVGILEEPEDSANKREAPPIPPRPASLTRRTTWNCKRCSFENPAKFENCQHCQVTRPDLGLQSHASEQKASGLVHRLERQAASAPPSHDVEGETIEKATRASIMEAAKQKSERIDAFLCPLTKEPMLDPVFTVDGQTYERKAIERWFGDGRMISPITGERLLSMQLIPNLALRKAMHDLLSDSSFD